MLVLYITSILALFISYIFDKKKTKKSLKISLKKFTKILPHFLVMLIGVSISLYFIPDSIIIKYLGGKSTYQSAFLASLIGSLSIMPGFIAFPLGGLLVKKGVTYTVIAAFTTSLMLVGFISFPLEKKILGTKIAIIRNIASYIIAIVVTVVISIAYGEL